MEIFDEIKKVSKVVFEKGKETGKFAKLKFDIATLESEIKELKHSIGNIVYKEKINTKNDEIDECIKNIDLKIKEIKEKETEISKLKEKEKE